MRKGQGNQVQDDKMREPGQHVRAGRCRTPRCAPAGMCCCLRLGYVEPKARLGPGLAGTCEECRLRNCARSAQRSSACAAGCLSETHFAWILMARRPQISLWTNK